MSLKKSQISKFCLLRNANQAQPSDANKNLMKNSTAMSNRHKTKTAITFFDKYKFIDKILGFYLGRLAYFGGLRIG